MRLNGDNWIHREQDETSGDVRRMLALLHIPGCEVDLRGVLYWLETNRNSLPPTSLLQRLCALALNFGVLVELETDFSHTLGIW